jgi:predicted TIM-barrel fold metal-dependent hydrolase
MDAEFEFAAAIWQKFRMPIPPRLSRRRFLITSSAALAASPLLAADAEPVFDIHQHTKYLARTDEDLIAHQRTMGVTRTLLLPAGTPVTRGSTHAGKSNGLAAGCGGNETVVAVAKAQPDAFYFGANEVTDLENAEGEIERYLKMGAKIIGEQKFGVPCDSPESERLYHLAEQYRVPVILHFQHATYNLGIERFDKVLAKFPKVNFIGHAQTFWANIDANPANQTVLYPKGPITPGGLTDRLLREYPNMYGDLSAGSGLNALTRDEEHTRAFFERHQDKLMFGSDCADAVGTGTECTGAQILAAVRRLVSSKAVERKLLWENAVRLFRV